MKKNTKKRIVAIGMGLVFGLGSLVVPGGTAEAATKLKVTCSKTVAINCTTKVKTNMKAKFSSSNKKIATVTSKGIVKGKKPGKVKITVVAKSNKKLKKTVTITVKKQLVVTAPENAKATLEAGKTVKIKTNLSSTFKSSNTSVATVSSNGVVTAQNEGTAKITVTSKKYNLKKTVTITVKGVTSSTQLPTTQELSTETPTTKESTTEIQSTEAQTTQEPATEAPPIQRPTTQISTTEEVTTEILTTQEPTTEILTTEVLTTETPTTEEPIESVPIGIEAEVKSPGRMLTSTIGDQSFIVTLKYNNGYSKILEYYEYQYYFTENPEEILIEYGEFTTIVDISDSIEEEELGGTVDIPSALVVRYDIENLSLKDMEDKSKFKVELLMSTGEFVELEPEEYEIRILNKNRNMYIFIYTYYFEYEGKEYFADLVSIVSPATEE